MNRKPNSYEGVALVSPVTIDYEKQSDKQAEWFIGRALAELLSDSGLKKEDVDGIALSSFTLAPDSAVSLTNYFSMTPRWLETIPLGGASGVVAMRRAARAIQAGDAEVVACIGGDTANAESFSTLIDNFSGFSSNAVHPYGAGGPNTVFSMITQHYMDKYDVKREDFARICMSQRDNALAASRSLFSKPLDLDSYLNARAIADPIYLFDCVMPCAGAEAFLLMSAERARSLSLPYVEIMASEELYNAYADDDIHYRGGWAMFRDNMYSSAGIGPEDVDLLHTYDDYPAIVMLQMEDLGFCEKGEAARFVQSTELTWNGGGLPHNTSGGQLSAGQAGAAGGFIGIVECIRQLTGQARGNAVENADIAVVSGYGMVIYDRCLSSNAAILKRGSA
ncbi:MAG: thiolase family protein [Gammaproteobacteria bacterium]|nr:thiolase family protein [Gammaproteobacteria bacterium]